MIIAKKSVSFRDEWEKELSPFVSFDGTLFEKVSKDLMFIAVLVKPSNHFLVMKLGMDLWDICVRMSALYESKYIKLRVGVTGAGTQNSEQVCDLEFEERICSFGGPPGPHPAGGHFSFEKMRNKIWLKDGNVQSTFFNSPQSG